MTNSLTLTVQYIIFEVPSNIMIKRISPSLWLGGITVLWGMSLEPVFEQR